MAGIIRLIGVLLIVSSAHCSPISDVPPDDGKSGSVAPEEVGATNSTASAPLFWGTRLPIDCDEVFHNGYIQSGLYRIWPRNRLTDDRPVTVYCDMDTSGGGWTVFQRRGNFGRSPDFFYKNWDYYKNGFGTPDTDFWLGNDNIYSISNQRKYALLVDMYDSNYERGYAIYDSFYIDSEETNYTLHVDFYRGNVGDSLSPHSNLPFTTYDRDNDHFGSNCASLFKGGWWYGACHTSNLNGLYLNGSHASFADGVEWSAWKGLNYSLPHVEMKIRPINFHTVG